MGIQNILVLTDFSKNAWEALEYARRLFQGEGCDIYLLNCYRREGFGPNRMHALDPDDGLNTQYRQHSERGLGRILSRIMEERPADGHKYYAISHAGGLEQAIEQVMKANNIDLLVMGMCGMTICSDKPYSRKVLRIARKIRNIPLLVVPVGARFETRCEILLLADLSRLADPEQITRMSEVAQLCHASVRVLTACRGHVAEADYRKQKLAWRSRLNGVTNSFQDLGRSGYFNAFSGVLRTNGKLLGHFRRKPNIWQRIGIKSPDSARILRNTKDPVLLL